MFKIDWPCAIGGTILGYYAKAKVESTKKTFAKISTDALGYLEESFGKENTQGTQQGTQQAKKNG